VCQCGLAPGTSSGRRPMMRTASARLREAWAGLLHTELDGVRTELSTSIDELRHDVVVEREAIETRAAGRDRDLAGALERIAGAFERVADGLEADRRDRAAQLETVEFLLRELVLSAAVVPVAPTARRPTVLGGTIDRAFGDAPVDIDLAEPPIAVDALVEVRSRFHDHWVHGFAVVEHIPGPRRRGYRLRRITDADQLPLLFDEADVRLAVPAPRQPVPEPIEEPDAAMWR
jgi:hypothetical protein